MYMRILDDFARFVGDIDEMTAAGSSHCYQQPPTAGQLCVHLKHFS